MCGPELCTERLLLRRWRPEDLEPFAQINADPQVMEFFLAPLSRAESAEMIERIEADFVALGYGLWAVEVPGETSLAGFVGLVDLDDALPFAPALEIGWRLGRRYWGRGLASEAATAAARFAFEQVGVAAIVATTARVNVRSRRLMERLGMVHDAAEDFLHPKLPSDHHLAPHVLYRLDATRWAHMLDACAAATPIQSDLTS